MHHMERYCLEKFQSCGHNKSEDRHVWVQLQVLQVMWMKKSLRPKIRQMCWLWYSNESKLILVSVTTSIQQLFVKTWVSCPPSFRSPYSISKRTIVDYWNWFYYETDVPTINIKRANGTQSTDPNQWPGLIPTSSTTGLLTEGRCLLYTSSRCQYFNIQTNNYSKYGITIQTHYSDLKALTGPWEKHLLPGTEKVFSANPWMTQLNV